MVGSLFATGIIIGFAIAAPVGPVGVLCAHRTIARGPRAGLVSGLGAAVADSIFGLIAAFGLSFVADWIADHQASVRLVGGVFLILLALRILLTREKEVAESTPSNSRAIGYFASTFALTITNPITILSFAGIFTAFGVVERVVTAIDAWILVGGVFAGSSMWWLFIAGGAGLLRGTLSERLLRHVNILSATIMLAFGAYALASSLPAIRRLFH